MVDISSAVRGRGSYHTARRSFQPHSRKSFLMDSFNLRDPLRVPLRAPLRAPLRDPLRVSLRAPVRAPLGDP